MAIYVLLSFLSLSAAEKPTVPSTRTGGKTVIGHSSSFGLFHTGLEPLHRFRVTCSLDQIIRWKDTNSLDGYMSHRDTTCDSFISLSAAAAKSLQSCPTLCDPIDGSPPGSAIPRILQARTLEWVAISLSNAWKWKVKVKSLSRVRLFTTRISLSRVAFQLCEKEQLQISLGCYVSLLTIWKEWFNLTRQVSQTDRSDPKSESSALPLCSAVLYGPWCQLPAGRVPTWFLAARVIPERSRQVDLSASKSSFSLSVIINCPGHFASAFWHPPQSW